MNYVTVYSILDRSFDNLAIIAIGVIFIVIGVIFVFIPRTLFIFFKKNRPISKFVRIYVILSGWLFLLFAVLWTAGATYSLFSSSANYANALKNNEYKIVEGRVNNFVPAPAEGHGMESFEVNGVPFSYSDYIITGGFNQTSSHGGPIKEGMLVRIAYKDGVILKIDIKK